MRFFAINYKTCNFPFLYFYQIKNKTIWFCWKIHIYFSSDLIVWHRTHSAASSTERSITRGCEYYTNDHQYNYSIHERNMYRIKVPISHRTWFCWCQGSLVGSQRRWWKDACRRRDGPGGKGETRETGEVSLPRRAELELYSLRYRSSQHLSLHLDRIPPLLLPHTIFSSYNPLFLPRLLDVVSYRLQVLWRDLGVSFL